MSAADYEKSRYLAGMETARQYIARLREHFEAVTINASYTDNSGTDVVLELGWQIHLHASKDSK